MANINYYACARTGAPGTHVLMACKDGVWYWFNNDKKWQKDKGPSFDQLNEYDSITQEQAKQIMKQDHT